MMDDTLLQIVLFDKKTKQTYLANNVITLPAFVEKSFKVTPEELEYNLIHEIKNTELYILFCFNDILTTIDDYIESFNNRVIIAGSRNVIEYNKVVEAVKKSGFLIGRVVSGHANGVDKLGELYGKKNNIPVDVYPANWPEHGKSAGYKRNKEMATNAEALVAIWDGESKGTLNMINLAKQHKLKTYVMNVNTKNT